MRNSELILMYKHNLDCFINPTIQVTIVVIAKIIDIISIFKYILFPFLSTVGTLDIKKTVKCKTQLSL